jgi:NADH:ubiquinone oxidoreductase subunit E
VASFYHLFQRRAPASHRIEVCWGTACFVNGAPRLLAQLAERLGVPGGQGRAGSWELLCSGCLGACGDRPVLRLDAGPATRVSVAPLAALAAHLDALGVPAGVPAVVAGVVPGSPP